MTKQFKLQPDQIRSLAEGRGSCIASDRITVNGERVGYMYREEPDNSTDSGWRFFAGDEFLGFADDPSNFEIYDVNTIANYDPEIVPLLDKPVGTAWARNRPGKFEADSFPK